MPYLDKGKITLSTTHAYAYGDEDDNYGWGPGQTIDDVENWLNEHGIDYTIDGVPHNNSDSGNEGFDYNENFWMSNDEWVAATSHADNSVTNYLEGLFPGSEISSTFYNNYVIGTEYEQSFKAIPHYDCTQAEFDDYLRYKQGVDLGLWWEVDPPKIIYYTYEFTGNVRYTGGSYYDDWLTPRQIYSSGGGGNTIYDLYGGAYHFLNYLPFTQNLLRNIQLPKDYADYLDQQLHGDLQLESALNDFLIKNNYNRVSETVLSVTIRAMMDNATNVSNPSSDKNYQFLDEQDNELTDMITKDEYLNKLKANYNADPSVVSEIKYLHAVYNTIYNALYFSDAEINDVLREAFHVAPPDINPNGWYFYSSVFGWTAAKLPDSGIFSQKAQNDAGYYQGTQVLEFLDAAAKLKERREREEKIKEFNEAAYEYAKSRNLFGLLYELSPLSAFYNGYVAYGNGQYIAGTILVSTGTVDIAPLFRTFGKGYGLVAREIAEKFTIQELWGLSSKWNFVRGSLLEVKMATTYIAKGFEWLAETASPFFKAIDFYNDATKTAISLKTVNATSNFEFKNILQNIDQLKQLKQIGKSAYNGVERVIQNVELHIGVPKGYDISVLNDVKKQGGKEVPVVIFEID
jgi:hypothetical protein